MNPRSRAHRILSKLEDFWTMDRYEGVPIPIKQKEIGSPIGVYKNINSKNDLYFFDKAVLSETWPNEFCLYYASIKSIDLNGSKENEPFAIVSEDGDTFLVVAHSASDRLEISRYFSRASEDAKKAS